MRCAGDYYRFTGPDCSIRFCPSGVAWADMPHANDTAHKPFVECSNFGYCDRESGACVCRAGYTGHACERMSCPAGGPLGSSCSGHGHCLNLQEAGEMELYLGNRADPFDGTVKRDSRTQRLPRTRCFPDLSCSPPKGTEGEHGGAHSLLCLHPLMAE